MTTAMEYEFRSDDGETLLRDYPMTSPPRIGAVLIVGGKRFERVLPRVQSPTIPGDRIAAHSLRKKGQPLAPDYDALGIPCVGSGQFKGVPVMTRSQAREFCARDDHALTPGRKIEYEF